MASSDVDVVILGAGGAGLMCAARCGARGRRALVLDHAKGPGEKIRISGGGRCNFTNLHTTPANFLSENPRFCISALRSYTQQDFIALVERYGIAWHEKTLGQLFCDDSAQQIIDMLLTECAKAGAGVQLETQIKNVARTESGFRIETSRGVFECASLVIATGGLSIPKIGASGLGYDIARQFGLPIVETRPGLVPLTFDDEMRATYKPLSGVSVDAEVRLGKTGFAEGLLFTHRGLSGPSILQISSYWREGDALSIDLARGTSAFDALTGARTARPRQTLRTALADIVPKRLAETIVLDLPEEGEIRLADCSNKALQRAAGAINQWQVIPTGTEGYRIAEVTLGGVSTDALSSKTMEARDVPGLYFIGEVVDVTGHLGGFNFQWAWSSAVAAGAYA